MWYMERMSLYKPGATLDLVTEIEKYKMKCVALQEIRWEDAGTTKVSQTTIFNGKCEHPYKLGTGFAIHESIIHTVKEFRDISPRISTITIESENFDAVLINAHAPTEEKDEDEKDLFYATLADIFASSTSTIRIVLGDFNAKLGREICYRNVIGNHSLHENTNNNGAKLIDFAVGNGLVIKSTMLPKKDIHKYTWVSPDGRYKNQIDHVLVNYRFKNSVLNVRTMRGADIGSDHLLLGIRIKVKLKKLDKKNPVNSRRLDIDKLENHDIGKLFVNSIKDTLQSKQRIFEGNIDEGREEIRDALSNVANKTLGTKKLKPKPWFNRICEEALQRRKVARQHWLNDTRNEELFARYKTRLRETSNILRGEKRKYVRNIMVNAELDYKAHRARDMYKRINYLTGGYKKKERFLKDNNGSLITTNEELAKKWGDYFDTLLNCEAPDEVYSLNLVAEEEQECPEPSLDEIRFQIKILKNHKSPGEDQIHAELLKKGGEEMTFRLWKLIHRIWLSEKVPEDWKIALVCPIHKKGDKQDCNNYRGIALLSVAYKVFTNCILSRIRTKSEQIIGDYQGGFRPGRSTVDQIFILRQLFQKTWEFDKEMHVLFIDFKKAYDSIHRKSLINILREYNFPQKLVKLIESCIMETFIKIRVGEAETDLISVNSGLRQGDSMSPVLFNLVLEKVIRETNIGPQEGMPLQGSSVALLAYADDLVLMDKSHDGLRSLCGRLEEAAKKVGLQINEDKTEYMVVGRKDSTRMYPSLRVGNHDFNRVKQFKYLGSVLTEKNETDKEVAARIQSGNKCLYGLIRILGSQSLSRDIKLQLYITLLRPIITYGAETWTLRKTEENKLIIFERKILRKIFGPVKDDETEGWRIRKNKELEELFQKPNILNIIQSRRLQWAGHAWRSLNPLLHVVLKENPKGKRSLGRPRLRWEDLIKKDVESLNGGPDWKTKAADRESWRIGCLTGWS
ncbi:unnamed protein product [Macrosiphum euphorbiae]|uniref:Reverse transcriptase domain-containing protein n=1 Tax=Macrosiphum euphorbiae TaxID=13131 RepID=A0AAV0XS06_9HEMI|nr:unnamed protein product [Macrosiphum euphorbiae]